MALTPLQQQQCAAYWVNAAFVTGNATATFNVADVQAAVAAVDAAFDTTFSAAVAAVGGSTTVINGLAAALPAPFNEATVAQKTMLVCHVLMKRGGLI